MRRLQGAFSGDVPEESSVQGQKIWVAATASQVRHSRPAHATFTAPIWCPPRRHAIACRTRWRSLVTAAAVALLVCPPDRADRGGRTTAAEPPPPRQELPAPLPGCRPAPDQTAEQASSHQPLAGFTRPDPATPEQASPAEVPGGMFLPAEDGESSGGRRSPPCRPSGPWSASSSPTSSPCRPGPG